MLVCCARSDLMAGPDSWDCLSLKAHSTRYMCRPRHGVHSIALSELTWSHKFCMACLLSSMYHGGELQQALLPLQSNIPASGLDDHSQLTVTGFSPDLLEALQVITKLGVQG